MIAGRVAIPARAVPVMRSQARAVAAGRRLDGYLHYYGKMKNQEGMLRDTPRVEAYRDAFVAAESRLRGATVMDVGTGSGVLAMLAARHGAAKVYAVEASREMAKVASRLVRANDLIGVVEVVPKHLEEVGYDEIPEGSVDIIVSELFSHFLVGEMGLQPVTVAKQRFLKPGGLVLPSVAHLKLSPFEDQVLGADIRARHQFWQTRDFHGLDLSAALPLALEQALRENVVSHVEPEQLLVAPAAAPRTTLDLAGPDDPRDWRRINFELQFPPRRRDAVIDGLCGWWDTVFAGVAGSPKDSDPVLSTAPDAKQTVWGQCSFLLNTPLPAKADAKLTVDCRLQANHARESYILKAEVVNHSTGQRSSVGPVQLSNVYSRRPGAVTEMGRRGRESDHPLS